MGGGFSLSSHILDSESAAIYRHLETKNLVRETRKRRENNANKIFCIFYIVEGRVTLSLIQPTKAYKQDAFLLFLRLSRVSRTKCF